VIYTDLEHWLIKHDWLALTVRKVTNGTVVTAMSPSGNIVDFGVTTKGEIVNVTPVEA
jgi:hypothetical protein